MDKYIMLEQMGSGVTSDVFLVEHRATHKQFVLKEMKTTGMNDFSMQRAKQEAVVLNKLDHPNIVRHKESFVTQDAICIVMERCCTSLERIIERKRHDVEHGIGAPFPTPLLLEWMAELLSAVLYLHSRKILHRDIKPSNIFVTETNHLKLGDLGVCKVLQAQDRQAGGSAHAASWGGSGVVMASQGGLIGTPMYLAPEILEEAPYTEASDIWALGVVFFEMCALRPLYTATNFMALVNEILTRPMQSFGNGVDLRFEKIVRSMLNKQPKERPSARDLIDRYVVVPDSHPSHPAQRPDRGRLIQKQHGLLVDVSSHSTGSHSTTTDDAAAGQQQQIPPGSPPQPQHASSSSSSSASSSAELECSRHNNVGRVDVHSNAPLRADAAAATATTTATTSSDGSHDAPPTCETSRGAANGGVATPFATSSCTARKKPTKSVPSTPSSGPAAAGEVNQLKRSASGSAAAAHTPSSSAPRAAAPRLNHSKGGPPQASPGAKPGVVAAYLDPTDHEEAMRRIKSARPKINVAELRSQALAMHGARRSSAAAGLSVDTPVLVPASTGRFAALQDREDSAAECGETQSAAAPCAAEDSSSVVMRSPPSQPPQPPIDTRALSQVTSLSHCIDWYLAQHETVTLAELDDAAMLLHQYKLARFGVY